MKNHEKSLCLDLDLLAPPLAETRVTPACYRWLSHAFAIMRGPSKVDVDRAKTKQVCDIFLKDYDLQLQN